MGLRRFAKLNVTIVCVVLVCLGLLIVASFVGVNALRRAGYVVTTLANLSILAAIPAAIAYSITTVRLRRRMIAVQDRIQTMLSANARILESAIDGWAMVYTIMVSTTDGRMGILCGRCGILSWNQTDVTHRYCGNCYLFHQPPAQPERSIYDN